MTSQTADRFRRVAEHFSSVIEAVPADRWSSASPCEDWTAIDLVRHVVTSQLEFLNRQPFGANISVDVADPLRAWPLVRKHVQAALDNPEQAAYTFEGYFGHTSFAATIDDFYSLDLVVHAWDLATAAGLDQLRRIDPAEMVTVRAALEKIEGTMRQPGLFGPAVALPDDTDEQARFLAFVGRLG